MLMAAARDTVKTLRRPYFFGLMWLSVVVTAIVFALLGLIGSVAFFSMHVFEMPFADQVFDAALFLGGMILAWMLLPFLIPLIGVVFMESIARRVAREEYGDVPLVDLPFGGEVVQALRFSLVALGLNVLFLPLYFFVVFAPFIYLLLNGYLLGRELFELAGALFVGRREAVRIRKNAGVPCLLAGIGIALMASLPIVNLFAPFVGAALMVHLFQRVAGVRADGPVVISS